MGNQMNPRASHPRTQAAHWVTGMSGIAEHPRMQEHEQLTKLLSGKLPDGWESVLPTPTPADKGKATRLHSQDNLNALAGVLDGAPVAPS